LLVRRLSRAESPELKYLRETRNAAVFIAIVAGIVCVLALVGSIVVGVQLSHLNANLTSGSGAASTCMSEGGTDPGR
jgi:ABC-type Fe3+ transport system permease subunit